MCVSLQKQNVDLLAMKQGETSASLDFRPVSTAGINRICILRHCTYMVY